MREAFPNMQTFTIAVGYATSFVPEEDRPNHPRLTFGVTTTDGARYIVSDARQNGFYSKGDQLMIQRSPEDTTVYDWFDMTEQEKTLSKDMYDDLISLAVEVLEL